MIHNVAKKLSSLLATENIIEQTKAPIYAYGFELLISGFVGVLLVVIISLIFGSPLYWIPYLSGYVLFRTNAGGFHAKNHMQCILTFLVIYTFLLLLHPLFHKLIIFPILVSIIFLYPIIKYAPLNVRNNPLLPEQKKKRRFLSLFVAHLNILFAIASIFIKTRCEWFTAYYLGVMAAGFLFAVAVMQENIERRKENEEQAGTDLS